MTQPTSPETAAQLVRLLVQQGRTIAVAESLTGGLVASTIVGVPGASMVFRGGVVAYSTDVKASMLGVDPGLLERMGAVDPDVADEMAYGVARLLGADYGLATTGVAGPDPQDGQRVGTVWISVVGPEGSQAATIGLTLDPALGRQGIREATLDEALSAALDHVGC